MTLNHGDRVVNTSRPYLLAAYIVLLGTLALVGWLYIGHVDDAPGAGMIGIAAIFSSLIIAFRVTRSKHGEQQ